MGIEIIKKEDGTKVITGIIVEAGVPTEDGIVYTKEFIKNISEQLPLPQYEYTLSESGKWFVLPFFLTPEEMIKRCLWEGNWGDCGPEIFPGEFKGHTKRTLIIENPDDELNNGMTMTKEFDFVPTKRFWVAALKFPDGKIWDSFLRDFRN